MARSLTTPQRLLLNAPSIKANVLMTMFLDSGTYRFCDNVYDMSDGTNTYIGASALTEGADIRSGTNMSAEPVTLVIDGNRMEQYGVLDPAKIFSEMLAYLTAQRRVDLAFGLSYPEELVINMVIPIYAGKINYVRQFDSSMSLEPGSAAQAKFEIVLDSLASRYNRSTNRMRTHEDQLEVDPSDNFYSFVSDIASNEQTIYWGKNAPYGSARSSGAIPGAANFGGGGNPRGGIRTNAY